MAKIKSDSVCTDKTREIEVKERLQAMFGVPHSRGLKLLRDHYSGKRLTQREMILANCCECMGYYADGLRDCCNDMCAFYRIMPYQPANRRGKKEATDEPIS